MKVMVVGSGAREHAIVWKLAQSPKVKEIYTAPGNAGTAKLGQNLPIDTDNIEELVRVAQYNNIELVVIGPDNPLADGIVDHFQKIGIPAFGPTRQAAQIEWSKAFTKELMQKHDIPCARGVTFTKYNEAREYIMKQTPPIWVKADGLAAGKGAIFAGSISEALNALYKIMQAKILGKAGDKVIIEECLLGSEMSYFAFTDGKTVVPMASACDYKRIYNWDRGPNTGGMGSYSPPQFLNATLVKEVQENIMEPAIRAMAERKTPYRGVLYGGLMITENGPKVIEFNARFGDPEAQVILPRLKTDLLDIMLAVINHNLDKIKVECINDACVGVVLASEGYPGDYKIGFPINGLDELDEGITVFHAGTKVDVETGKVVTNGGRVLTMVALGETLTEAREKVYDNVSRIHFEGCYYREDIAKL